MNGICACSEGCFKLMPCTVFVPVVSFVFQEKSHPGSVSGHKWAVVTFNDRQMDDPVGLHKMKRLCFLFKILTISSYIALKFNCIEKNNSSCTIFLIEAHHSVLYHAALSEIRWSRADGERFSCTVLLSSNQIRKSITAH